MLLHIKRGLKLQLNPRLRKNTIFVLHMRPDYPYKVFNDKRVNYVLLIEALATDSRL